MKGIFLKKFGEVDLAFERRAKAVVPVVEGGQDRHVVGFEHVKAWSEHIRELAFMNENSGLAFANGEFRPVFDFMALALEAPHECVAGIIGPVNDVDKLAGEEIENAHGGLPLGKIQLGPPSAVAAMS